jgi:hypothetical protein
MSVTTIQFLCPNKGISVFNSSFHESADSGVADSELQPFGADLLHAAKWQHNAAGIKKLKNLFIVVEFYKVIMMSSLNHLKNRRYFSIIYITVHRAGMFSGTILPARM